MTSSADNCDVVAQPHSKTTSTGNVIQQRDSELASSENNRQVDLGESESDIDQEDASVDVLSNLGTEAIEQLASGLNLAANTIEGYSQNTIDEENLKQLNDEQLLRLLEEAYHSKKLDEKNKSAIFKEILEDVHESLATPDNNTTKSAQNKTTTISPSASQQSSSFNTTKPNQINIATNQICCSSTSKTNSSQRKSSSLKNAAKFDSIAALTEIMDSSSSSNITIPASGSGLVQKSNSDPDADTSSTKTEVEEMELDQFSDLEDNLRAHENAKKLDENGNPPTTSGIAGNSGSSVSFTARQLKPLSIYRHNPAFHSQHVSVNQLDEIPPLSPTALQPTTQLKNTNEQENDRMLPAKSRRKKKAVKTEESIKAEEIDGYRGGEDLESLLQFIEAKPKSTHPDLTGNGGTPAPQTSGGGGANSSKSKRSRRTDHKSKRSRTPSVTTPSQEKSPDTSQSQKTSRASSISAANTVLSGLTENLNAAAVDVNNTATPPDSVTTVKNSLIIPNNVANNTSLTNNKKSGTLKKPKKQAGWLVDFNNDIGAGNGNGKNRIKSKPPSGSQSKNLQEFSGIKHKEQEKECEEVICNTTSITNEDSSDEAEPISIQDEIILTEPPPAPPFDEKSVAVTAEQLEQDNVPEETDLESNTTITSHHINQFPNKSSSQKNIQEQEEDVCFNYASILKFIKQEWDIVTMEISNGSNDIQSKVVYYRPREKI